MPSIFSIPLVEILVYSQIMYISNLFPYSCDRKNDRVRNNGMPNGTNIYKQWSAIEDESESTNSASNISVL